MQNSKTLDLSEGNVKQRILQYAVPFVIMSLMQSLYSVADLLIAGHFIGSRGISGITNSSQIMVFLTQVIIGLSQGGNILIGQFFGAREEEKRKETTNTLFFSFLILAVFVTIVVFLLSGEMLRLLGAPAFLEARDYLRISSIGIVFIFGYNALVAAVRGVGDSKRPMKIIMITALVNIVLDIVFVGIMKMGTSGAAGATVIAQGISFLLMLVYVIRQKEIYGIWLKRPRIYVERFLIILRLGIPCAIQMSLAGLSWLTVTKFINGYGITASAGSGVSARIKEFCQLFIISISSASATIIAQTLGAKKYERAKEVLYTSMKITLVVSSVLIVIVEVMAPILVGVFAKEPEVIQVAVKNLRIEIIGQLFYAIFMMYHALAIGAGHTWFVLLSSFVNCILVRVVLVMVFERIVGLNGVFWACMIAPASSVPIGVLYLRSNIWKKKLQY